MKKTIDGKTYNTDTATAIGNWSNNLGRGDFKNCNETLYVTAKGNYFIAGEGGPMTRWSQPCGNMTSGGDGILALTKQEALNWCEQHDCQDVIDEHFADLVEEA